MASSRNNQSWHLFSNPIFNAAVNRLLNTVNSICVSVKGKTDFAVDVVIKMIKDPREISLGVGEDTALLWNLASYLQSATTRQHRREQPWPGPTRSCAHFTYFNKTAITKKLSHL